MRHLLSLSVVFATASSASALASTWHVATSGNDSNNGSATAPWKTIQKASSIAVAGDTVIVEAGTYTGFTVGKTGTASAPIVFRANGTVAIDGKITSDRDAIHIENASYITIDGFTVTGATRSGISAITSDHITVRNSHIDSNGKWGVFSAFCDDLLVEHNEISRSAAQHGVYASNSADRPIIRNNMIWGNGMCGVHINGDISQGGDGVISNALVENNVITNNGTLGGSGINGDGIQNAIIRNNVLDGNHASGVSLYDIDGGAASTGNLVINNTIRMASDARSAINIQDSSTGNTIRNNILLDPSANKGAIDICSSCMPGTVSNNNAVVGKFLIDGNMKDLATWRTASGQDASSFVAVDADLFTSATDLSLKAGSVALDKGVSTGAPATDIIGTPRPQGSGIDLGAYERCTGTCSGSGGGGGSGSGGGSSSGSGSGSGSGSDGGGSGSGDCGGCGGSGSDTGSGSDGQDYSGQATATDDGNGGCDAGGHGMPGLLVLVVFGLAMRRRARDF